MTFYERYEALCRVRGIDPCSQSTAEKLGTTRSNVSYWKKVQSRMSKSCATQRICSKRLRIICWAAPMMIRITR